MPKNRIISDIPPGATHHYDGNIFKKSSAPRKNPLQDERAVLAYKKIMQSRPRVIDLRKANISRIPQKDYIVKVRPLQKTNIILKKPSAEIARQPAAAQIHPAQPNTVFINTVVDPEKYKKELMARITKKFLRLRRMVLYKQFAGFLIIAFLAMFSVKSLAGVDQNLKIKKNKILGEANIAAQYLISGKDSISEKDYVMASYKFKVAGERFFAAQNQLNFLERSISNLLSFLPSGTSVSSAKNLLEAGGNISYAAENLSQAFLEFNNTQDIFAEIKGKPRENDKRSFTDALSQASSDLGLALYRLDIAQRHLDKVKNLDFSGDKTEQIKEIKETIPQLREGVEYFLNNIDVFLEILGHERPKKYMFFFENSRELRPTGGFLGTQGTFDLNEGRVENFKIQSPYVISGQYQEKIQAPESLRLIQSRFNFHDANWFFDFPTSARKIMLMNEKAGWETADGVFVITADIMPELLSITGPISMPEYNTEVNADNFFEVTQKEVEINYDKEINEPKKFIGDLFPKVLERVFSLDEKGKARAMQVFLNQVFRKNVLIYFRDERLENLVKDWGMSGEIKSTPGDYFSMVLTNIGGGKTDNVIDHKIYHQSEILADGRVIDTVNIVKKHNGDLNNFWTSVKNMTFMKIYVPAGSRLIEATGFDPEFFNPDILQKVEDDAKTDLELEKDKQIHEASKTRIYQMEGKTVFGNWSGLEVGQTKTITLKYELPFRIKLSGEPALAKYSLLVQRQSGTLPFNFFSDLYIPGNFNEIWKNASGYDLDINENKVHYETDLSQDRGYGLVFNEKIKN